MDFDLEAYPAAASDRKKPVMVFACMSRRFFSTPLRAARANPLVLTTGLMAPEAYVLDAAARAWIAHQPPDSIASSAAVAYNKYQKCGREAARRLFTPGLR